MCVCGVFINLTKRVCAHVSCFVCRQLSTPEDTEIYTFDPWRTLSEAEFSTMVSQATVQAIGSCALSISLRAEALLDFIFIYFLSLICLARVRHIGMPSLRAFVVSCSCQSKVILYLPGELILPASCHIKKMFRGRLLLMQNIPTWEWEGSKSLVNTSLPYTHLTSVCRRSSLWWFPLLGPSSRAQMRNRLTVS